MIMTMTMIMIMEMIFMICTTNIKPVTGMSKCLMPHFSKLLPHLQIEVILTPRDQLSQRMGWSIEIPNCDIHGKPGIPQSLMPARATVPLSLRSVPSADGPCIASSWTLNLATQLVEPSQIAVRHHCSIASLGALQAQVGDLRT